MKYFPRIRSKNHSLDTLRRANRGLPAMPVKSVVRFGSVTPTKEIFRKPTNIPIVEINTVEAVRISSSKLLMKGAFKEAKVNQPDWYIFRGNKVVDQEDKEIDFKELPYPLVFKKVYGSKGRGMELIEDEKTLTNKLADTGGAYLEKYYSYTREYRLHCTKDGCFYACRKMLKTDAEARWFRNDSNCVWYVDTNDGFDRPDNWDKIEAECVIALAAVGLDFGAFDVRVQSSKNKDNTTRKDPKFIIIEVNSAPSFGDITEQKYQEILPQLIIDKANA